MRNFDELIFYKVSAPIAGRGTRRTLESHFLSSIPLLYSTNTMQEQFEPLKNDLLLRAARGMPNLSFLIDRC